MAKEEDKAWFLILAKEDRHGSTTVLKEEDEARCVIMAKEEQWHGTKERTRDRQGVAKKKNRRGIITHSIPKAIKKPETARDRKGEMRGKKRRDREILTRPD